MKKVYWQILLDLWKDQIWVDGTDYYRATHGSPKLTSRISDMRKRGVDIVSRPVPSPNGGRHFAYALGSSPAEVKRLMRCRT